MSIITQIENLISNNKFEHFYLYKNVLRAYDQEFKINSSWLKGDTNSWILGFSADGLYNIYGLNYSDELLSSVIKELDFNKLPTNTAFSGNKKLLTKIFSANPEIKYEVYKERYFYETTVEDFKPFENSELIVRQANHNDINIISEFNCKFFEEEYKGENNKDLSEMKLKIQHMIQENKLLVVQKDKNVVGFCSKMDTDFDNEMVGTVFVEINCRKLNYGKSVLSEMTKNILKNNSKSWLMTDVTSVASNKLMESLGYKRIFEYTSGQIKKQSAI